MPVLSLEASSFGLNLEPLNNIAYLFLFNNTITHYISKKII